MVRIVSHHYLRRTARRKAIKLEREFPTHTFRVAKAARGPYRWRVERLA